MSALFSTSLAKPAVHAHWHPMIHQALEAVGSSYLAELSAENNWLPGKDAIFNAFSIPPEQVKYILFGESPYPRSQSANGYAFWDNAVTDIWSTTGFAKPVNRATSLRNFIKMLLIAKGSLSSENTSQSAIAAVDKDPLVKTLPDLFHNMLEHGFLLLNASLVFRVGLVRKDAKAWLPFMIALLEQIASSQPLPQMVLFGRIAQIIDSLEVSQDFSRFYAEHPFNVSFVTNKAVIEFFQPLDLLQR